MPPFSGLKDQEISDALDFVLPCSFSAVLPVPSRHTGEFSYQCYHGLVLILSLFTESMYPHCGSVDHEMSDASDLPCTSDSDVAGPGATLNNDSMNIDIDVSNSLKSLICTCTITLCFRENPYNIAFMP